MTARKLWATRYTRISGPIHRHQSKAAAYRYVRDQATTRAAGSLRPRYLVVYVDECNGEGWTTYEVVDLAEWGAA